MVAPLLGFAIAMGAAGAAKYGSSFIDDLFLQRKETRKLKELAAADAKHDAGIDSLFGGGDVAAAAGGDSAGLLAAATPRGSAEFLADDFDPFAQAAQQNAVPGGALAQAQQPAPGLLPRANQSLVEQSVFGAPTVGAGGDRRGAVAHAAAPGSPAGRRELGADLLKLGGHDTLASSLITGSYKSEETLALEKRNREIEQTRRKEDRGFAVDDTKLALKESRDDTATAVTTGRETSRIARNDAAGISRESTRLSQLSAAEIQKKQKEAAIQASITAAEAGRKRSADLAGVGGVRPGDAQIASTPNSPGFTWSKNPVGEQEVYRRNEDGTPLEVPQQFSGPWMEGVKELNKGFKLAGDVGRLIDLHNQYGTQRFPTKISGEMQSIWTAAMFSVGRGILDTGAMQGEEFGLTSQFIRNPNANYTDIESAEISGSLNTVFRMINDKNKELNSIMQFWPGVTEQTDRLQAERTAREVPFGDPSEFDEGDDSVREPPAPPAPPRAPRDTSGGPDPIGNAIGGAFTRGAREGRDPLGRLLFGID